MSMRKSLNQLDFDRYLVATAIGLLLIGMVMIASASSEIAQVQIGEPFYYLAHQVAYVFIGVAIASVVVRIEFDYWYEYGYVLLFLSLALLVIVLIPGVGREINGSQRWIGLGFLNLQVSEFVKLALVIYLAGYLTRHQREVQTRVSGFLKPMIILGLISLLLLKEPDFGAAFVLTLTVLSMLFIGGVRLGQFILLLFILLGAMGFVAVSAPYRVARLTAFLNPWQHQFGSSYQLTQSLIAFGRGGITGVGLGDSVQKLFYLPEAHTDFLFAVLAEELGLIGVMVVVILYCVLVWRAFVIGWQAKGRQHLTASYTAYGFAVWLAMQAAINMGVTSGLFPTKGLTMPLLSYGGSSMLINCIVLAILLRIDYENRLYYRQQSRS